MKEYPSISQYVDTLTDPFGLTRTLAESEPELDAYGKVKFRAGNASAIFRVKTGGEAATLKCFIKHTPHTEDIYDYVAAQDDRLLVGARLLREELYVYDALGKGEFHDVVIYPWVEGNTLEEEIRRAANESGAPRFAELSRSFDALAAELLEREWAHGDLKPENIIVKGDGSMQLIDYDAMFLPSLERRQSTEVGTPTYQHPARDEKFFNKHVDDYPVALISASLRALAIEPGLYHRYHTCDNIILHPSQIIAGTSEAYHAILELFATRGHHDSYRIASCLRSVSPRIDHLSDMFRTVPPASGENLTLFERKGLWGYATENGVEVIPPTYESATEFNGSLAVVCLHGLWQVIDRSGAVVIADKRFAKIKPFSEGLSAIEIDGTWGYMDSGGRVAITPAYQMAGPFSEGAAVVKQSGKYGFIDAAGRVLAEPQYDHATCFRQGRSTVEKDGRVFPLDREHLEF